MPSLTLNGVSINFPFPPYDCQRDYMSKVIECLQKRVNGVLESPTGTGKTLCLLCAALAWRETFRDSISARNIAQRLQGAELFPDTPLASWGSNATDGDKTAYYTDIPKIIYASRTHSQLAQVMAELRSTSYRPKVCVLGSREQLCINQEVMRQESNHVKVHMCRGKVSTRSCVYYNNVEERSTDKDLVNSILDVEDLVKFGNKQRACPYYLSRSLKQQADVIFMPYNYLLDPKSRRAHNIELNGAVVIFDEAHNVEKTCEESTSFDLTPYDVASAISAVDRLLTDAAQHAANGREFDAEAPGAGLKLEIETIAKIKQILLDLEAVVDSFDVPSDRGLTRPGIFIYEVLERAHLTYSSKAAVSEALEQITGQLATQPGVFLNTGGLQKLSDIIQLVFCGDPSEKDRQQQMELNTAHFKVHIHKDSSTHRKRQGSDPWSSAGPKKQGNTLSYWCFSPGFSMQDLVQQGVRCLLLTSGTLSPLSSFTSEMRIEFPVSLENGHVIGRDQICVSVVDRGPDGQPLSSAFDRRFVPENMASLGNTVANLSRVVPDGLLVFFPSFSLMEKNLEFWRANGHAERIESQKPMFVEPKGKGTFNEVIEGYYSRVRDPASRGGSFFAVCRGKASEGLDFADGFGRGVVITGLPFPPKMDPRVVLKMQFLDEMSRKKAPGVRYLSGQEWYRQQAFRAVNQAIGRVIRHKDDYGAIFLCDQRFRSPDARAQLPSWVRPHVRLQDGFGNVVRDAAQFFRVAQKLRPVVPKTTKEGSCSVMGSTQSGPPQTCPPQTSCPPQAQKAKVLDAHLPSLKRRRLDAAGSSSRMPRICIDYELQPSPRRPASLLDALQRGEAGGGGAGGGGGGTGEEASRASTLELQMDKRREDELRGGRRRIKLVQDQRPGSPEGGYEAGGAGRARRFLADMKASLSQASFERVVQALQAYKAQDLLEPLLQETALLAQDRNTHSLLRAFYQFVRPHHKQIFDQRCVQLTGRGCGYQPAHSLSKDQRGPAHSLSKDQRGPAHSLSKDQKGSVLLHGASEGAAGGQSSIQLDTQQLNGGGKHLGQQGLKQPQPSRTTPGSSLRSEAHASFLADVKAALGPEKSSLLFRAVHGYKRTEDYERLLPEVVGLLTERDQDFGLLQRFGAFVRPQHRKRYNQMLDALAGRGQETAGGEETACGEETAGGSQQQPRDSLSPPLKTQSKISSFFWSGQKK